MLSAEDVPLLGTKRPIMSIKIIVFIVSFLSSIIKNKSINPAGYLLERYDDEIKIISKALTLDHDVYDYPRPTTDFI